MTRYILYLIGSLLLGLALLLNYLQPAPVPSGGLSVAAVAATPSGAGLIHTEGTGNFHRFVTGHGVDNQTVLEMAAGPHGQIANIYETLAGPEVIGRFHVQFLSTQGTGRVVLEALDADQNPIASVTWLITGDMPPSDAANVVIDKRMQVNFRGDWLKEQRAVEGLFQQLTDGCLEADKYRLSVIAGEGQHVLVRDTGFFNQLIAAIRVTPEQIPAQAVIGERLTIVAEYQNISRDSLPKFQAGIWLPGPYGLLVDGNAEHTVEPLGPGSKIRLTWHVVAQRPDLANYGRPWPVFFTVNGEIQGTAATIAVADNRPGKIFYVMTEDLEPIDSAGYSGKWGNGDGWLNSDEFRVQMLDKAEKMNSIAEQYQAKWTHFIAWPAVRAAEWAAGQSNKAEWQQLVADLRQSVIQQSAKGHEYALHMHSDYDPDLAENVLSYNSETDGLWANHRRHGWAHSILQEGDFSTHDSRTGIMYYYQRILDQLTQDSGQGQILTARAGSFDFGDGAADEAMSTRAYKRVGLLASSDADGNIGGITSAEFGQEIYLARFDDINTPAESAEVAGLVEFRPTPKTPIKYDADTAETMNAKTDLGVAAFTSNGQIKPGIHAIIGFTHAMFMMGSGDWRSLTGGQFDQLSEHLRYVRQTYVDNGIVQFATASQLTAEYLDYYTPQPVAVYGAKLRQGMGVVEYAIRILGKDIPINERYPHLLKVKLPLYLRDSAFFAQVLKNGEPIYSTWEPAADNNDIPFIANDRNAIYTIRVFYDDGLAELKKILLRWQGVWR